MDPIYTWTRIGKHDATEAPSLAWYLDRQAKPHILDICGALIQPPSEFRSSVDRWIEAKTRLCITGELKRSVDGAPASNYRYKKDEVLNNNVVANYIYLFELHQLKTGNMPIFVTTIPRSFRLYSWFIQEDGVIIRKDEGYRKEIKPEVARFNELDMKSPYSDTDRDLEDTELLEFLNSFGVTQISLIKIRESCKGARYHTYLIDMISFLYQMKIDSPEFFSTFTSDYRVPIHTSDDDVSKLSFEDTLNDGSVFFSPKNEGVEQLYHEMTLAISPQENTVKAAIRGHLVEHRIDRWTDFDANDTDDAFLFLMLINAFKGDTTNEGTYGPYNDVSMTSEEGEILDSLEKIMAPWFSQID